VNSSNTASHSPKSLWETPLPCLPPRFVASRAAAAAAAFDPSLRVRSDGSAAPVNSCAQDDDKAQALDQKLKDMATVLNGIGTNGQVYQVRQTAWLPRTSHAFCASCSHAQTASCRTGHAFGAATQAFAQMSNESAPVEDEIVSGATRSHPFAASCRPFLASDGFSARAALLGATCVNK
jgi:hypothetical protein